MPSDGRRWPDGTMAWVSGHKQRLLYGLAACSLVVAVAGATLGGVLLHRAANVERQALRTQELAGAVAELQDFPSQVEAQGATKQLAARRKNALHTANQLFRNVRAHDRGESDRIRTAFLAYVRGSTTEFNRTTASGLTSPSQRNRTDRELSRFEARVSTENRSLAATASDTNPEARMALIGAAVAAALLVALLIWQFEVQRRAGRIDRDNLARSQELSRLREALVATVSHELRTPLTSIIGYVDLLNDPETTPLTVEQQGFLDVVQRNADRLLDLVGDLLLVAEADGGRLALDLQDVNLDALAATCVESAQPAADARQIELTLERGPARQIHGDPNRLGQMMDNLVSNAIKFTPVGGHVAVRTAVSRDLAVFEVSDNGPGISGSDQEHLFDRFFRTRTAIDQAVKGTGLGLAITKAIVEAHQGTITVDSALGSHTTFLVELPALE